MKMRILYIINSFTWGGAEKLVFDLALNLSDKVEHVGIITLYKKDDATEKEMCDELNKHGVHTVILNKRKGKDWVHTIREIRKYVLKNQISIIHGHCTIPMLFGKITGFLTSVPVVCTVHSTKEYSVTKEVLTSWLAKRYISICDAAENYMVQNLRIPPKKIVRIYNAIETKSFLNQKKEKSFWSKYGGKNNDVAVLNVGRVTESKNQMCLLKAFCYAIHNSNYNFRLYFLGEYNTNDSTYKEMIQYIADNKLSDNVVFLGKHRKVSDFLINSSCFVMTSFFEGLSVAFLEAVVSGIPVISTDMPFVHELNNIAHCAKVIPQNDSKTLGETLARMDFQPQTSNTIKIFSSIFSMDLFAQKHLDLYRSILCNE